MKIKHKKIKKLVKKKIVGLHVASVAIIAVSLLFTGSVVVMAQTKSNQIDQKIAHEQVKLDEYLANLKNNKEQQKTTTTQSTPKEEPKEKPAEKTPENKDQTEVVANPIKKETIQPEPEKKAEPNITPAQEPTPAISVEVSTSLSYINSVRAGVGKPALQLDYTVSAWALTHTQTQVNSCSIYHQNISQFFGASIAGKSVSGIAENVGYAMTVDKVLSNLKNSSGHYANMIGDYTHVGIGVVKAGTGGCQDYIYTTQIFVR